MQQHLGGYNEREDPVGLIGDDRLDEFAAPRRRWPAAVLTAIVMALFAGGLWFFYHQGARQSVVSGPGGEVPLIRADDRPMKIKPDQPGGMPVPDQNISVYEPKPGAERNRRSAASCRRSSGRRTRPAGAERVETAGCRDTGTQGSAEARG